MTDLFPREDGWDSSVREEPLGEWCAKHGFYSCPVCRGEEPVWIIPIMEGSQETGTITVHAGGEVAITGAIRLPTPSVAASHANLRPLPDPEPAPRVFTPSPDLIAQIKESFSTVESLLNEPRHREAAARGRKVHDDALALAEREGIPYADAVQQVLDGRT